MHPSRERLHARTSILLSGPLCDRLAWSFAKHCLSFGVRERRSKAVCIPMAMMSQFSISLPKPLATELRTRCTDSARVARGDESTLLPTVVLRHRLATRCYVCYVAFMRTITQRELRNESAAVLRDVQAGEVIIVTRNGTPVAELRPVAPRRFVSRAAIAGAARGAPRIDSRRFRADVDAHVGQYVDGQ